MLEMDVNKIRKDFPTYDGDNPTVFLDSACQTLRPRQVIDAIVQYYEEYPYCAGRSVYGSAMKVEQSCEEARDTIAGFLHANDGGKIVFTKNTTEGLNIVLFGKRWESGDEIICSDREHNSVLLPLLKLSERYGVKIRRASSLPNESFDLERFKEIVNVKTKLVAICHTSNVTGYTLPAKEIAEIAHDHGAELLLDAAQSVPHKKIDVEQIGADYLSLSVHKMCGPSGVGALYGRTQLLEELEPLTFGGMTVSDSTYESMKLLPPPQKFEAGLQDYAGIIGAGAAAKYLQKIGLEEIENHEHILNRILVEKLRDIDGLSILPPENPAEKGGIFSFNIKGHDPHDIALMMDTARGILIRSGHHCCHSWFHSRNIDGCARASLYLYNDREDVNLFADAVRDFTAT